MVFNAQNEMKILSQLNNHPSILLNNSALERVSEFKFLGVIIDESLLWNQHIKKVCSKLSSTCGVLARLKNELPTESLRTIYLSLFMPHIMYGAVCWYSDGNSNVKRVKILQKKAIRHVCNAKYNSHADPLFKECNTLKANDINTVLYCKLLYRYHHGKVSEYIKSSIHINRDLHRHNTRQAGNIHRSHTASQYERLQFEHRLSICWNNLPDEIKSFNCSIHTFTNNVKKYLISQYQEQCTILNCYICNRQ